MSLKNRVLPKVSVTGRNAALRALFLLVGSTGLYFIGVGVLYVLAYSLRGLLYALVGSTVYYFITDYKWNFIIFGFIILVLAEGYYLFTRPYRQMAQVMESVAALLDEQKELPKLPADLHDIELTLQNTRLAYQESLRRAREAEQRKNDLVVYLAHDLKTPLTSIIGYLSLLEECPDLPVEQRAKYLSITVEKAYRLEQLINEFFEITRFNLQTITLEKGRLDLSLLLHQLIEEFEPMLQERQLTVVPRIAEQVKIIADGDRLARVFDNLLRNAISYSYDKSVIQLSLYVEGPRAIVTVRNRGDQIPPEKLARIFEKFFRADSARGSRSGGAGLGLAIAKQIVELHGGAIHAESNLEFTEFTVSLPIGMVSASSS